MSTSCFDPKCGSLGSCSAPLNQGARPHRRGLKIRPVKHSNVLAGTIPKCLFFMNATVWAVWQNLLCIAGWLKACLFVMLIATEGHRWPTSKKSVTMAWQAQSHPSPKSKLGFASTPAGTVLWDLATAALYFPSSPGPQLPGTLAEVYGRPPIPPLQNAEKVQVFSSFMGNPSGSFLEEPAWTFEAALLIL